MTTLDIGGTNVTSTAAELNILDGADVIYKGKIFCTDSSDYSVNTNQYVQETSYDNDYIIL